MDLLRRPLKFFIDLFDYYMACDYYSSYRICFC